jgi:hypothetical protein
MEISEIRKPVCVDCKHLEPVQFVNIPSGTAIGKFKGCSIYEARPQACRDFDCIWLQSQTRDKPLSRHLRPDKCGVMFVATTRPNTLAAHSRHPGALGAGERLRNTVYNWLKSGVEIVHICGSKRTLMKWQHKRLNEQIASENQT